MQRVAGHDLDYGTRVNRDGHKLSVDGREDAVRHLHS